VLKEAGRFEAQFDEAMDDDFNTADAIAAVFDLVKYANTHAKEGGSKALALALCKKLQDLCGILGIITEKQGELLDGEIERLIEERQAARKAKDFARADEIRNLLLKKGIVLEDTREGVKWKRA
ncbi:MAG: cysteine--tRNA ligase, partial [Lachnospiraceae bacterium]|nr:cysteine--tRNA ligase [Lachnospiraceae bacterium]